MELNNASIVGNAEAQGPVKEVDGAQDMMDVKEPHFLCKQMDLIKIAEHVTN